LSRENALALLSKATGDVIEEGDLIEQDMVIRYAGERRLATARGVMEIKEAIQVCQISTGYDKPLPWWVWTLYAVGFTTVIAGFFLPSYNSCPSVARDAISADECEPINVRLLMSLLGVVISVAGAVFQSWPRSRDYKCISYCPHLVSCVLSEYDRDTNVEAARTNLRAKMRRLACLPLPDVDAVKFIEGSELVVEFLLDHTHFFGEGAACFRQPE